MDLAAQDVLRQQHILAPCVGIEGALATAYCLQMGDKVMDPGQIALLAANDGRGMETAMGSSHLSALLPVSRGWGSQQVLG